jgi:hypothetical protein
MREARIGALHRDFSAPASHQRVHGQQAPRRFTQGSRGQAVPVAETAPGVGDGNFHDPGQRQMLQPVVADHEFGTRAGRERGRRNAIGADHDHVCGPACVQQRLVADQLRRIVRAHDPWRTTVRAAVAAQHDADAPALGRQGTRQPRGHRRLAGAADRQVADYDHRHRRTARAREPDPVGEAPQADGAAVQRLERPQRQAAPARSVPEPLKRGIQTHSLNCNRYSTAY